MTYDAAFFSDNRPIALSAAEAMLPSVIERTGSQSVIDVGCGQGAWLSVAKFNRCRVKGIDGNAPEDQLMIDVDEFERRDLTDGVSCAGYDLALSLEVAEHLPESSARPLVQGLTGARYVLFSGAHPGQGGISHINEQWSTWWSELFAEFGYVPSVDIRWEHWGDNRVQDFYRENMIVFATEGDLARAGYSAGVCDVIHPVRFGKWEA